MFVPIFISFIILVVYVIKRQLYLRKFDKLKTPPKWPLIGHYFYLKDRELGLKYALKHTKEYGKTYKIFAGPIPAIITSDSKLLELVLGSNKNSEKSKEYKNFKRWWGDGLLVSSGSKWKSHRKILTPAFHYNILEDFVDVFETSGKFLIENLDKLVGKDTFNIIDVLSLYTFDVICATAMGTNVNAQKNPDHKYFKSIRQMCDIGSERAVSLYLRFDFIYKFTSMYKKELKLVSEIKDFSLGIIKKRKDFLEKNGFVFNETDEFGKRRKTTFMDILLCSKINDQHLSDEEVREEVDTFLFEGFDTTSIALSFIAYNLSKHPNIQNKVYEEIKDIFGNDKNRPAKLEDLQNMPYLEMVIKESLRLYPSVPIHARTMLEDLEYDGYVIPKGITLVINQFVLHRDEAVFPDPEKFDPERFDLNNMMNRDPYAYIPFSAGSRNCIGQKFAMLELKSAISKILKHFEILPAKPEFTPDVMSMITLYSINGVHVSLRRRT